jgi:hypothetical protein
MNKELLKELNLIDEGEIIESDGSPAYTIKGSIFSEEPTIIEKYIQEGIRNSEILNSFFEDSCDNPENYFKELAFRMSHYYPTFYFLRKANTTNEDGVSILKQLNESEINNNTRKKLIERLQGNELFKPVGMLLKNISTFKIDFKTKIPSQINTFLKENELKGLSRDKSVARSFVYNLLINKEPIQDFF